MLYNFAKLLLISLKINQVYYHLAFITPFIKLPG